MTAPRPSKEKTAAEKLADKLAAAASLSEAIALTRPFFTDTTNELSPGTILLANWLNREPNWDELTGRPDTKYGIVQKDPVAVRGQLLCNRGRIIQIRADRSTTPTVYTGLLSAGWAGNITSFVAVGSTGDLVARSQARFCGIIVGTYSYDNTGGGVSHAVQTVGMFDLKANRQLGRPAPAAVPKKGPPAARAVPAAAKKKEKSAGFKF